MVTTGSMAEVYSDYFGIGKGCGNFLASGVYDLNGSNPDYTKRKRFCTPGSITSLPPPSPAPGWLPGGPEDGPAAS